jgi:hypothetical protein
MKRLLFLLIFLITGLTLSGQGNTWKYVINANGGLRVGGLTLVKIDSITSTAGDIRFWSGGAPLTAVPGVGSGTWGAITGTLANQIDLSLALGLKANLVSPVFTGTPTVPGYVPTTTTVNGHALSGNITVTATDVGLGNVTNESKATMFTNPVLTGSPTVPGYVPTSTTVNGHALSGNVSVTAADVSLGNVTNESKATMFTSPTFTGHPTIEGVTATGATGTGNLVFSASPTLTTPALGTPSAIVLTNATGTAASLTAGAVTGYTPASGSLTLSGADAITLSTTNTTSVTLPTSGTLISSADTSGMLGNYPLTSEINTRYKSFTNNISAGAETDVTLTGVTTAPYSIQIYDSDDWNMSHAVKDSIGISGGVYHVYIYSTDAKTNAKIKVLW